MSLDTAGTAYPVAGAADCAGNGKQALLEDIALGNAVDASRLPQIEQLTLNLNQQKTALQSQYELKSSSPTR
jgi:hypothetical protein